MRASVLLAVVLVAACDPPRVSMDGATGARRPLILDGPTVEADAVLFRRGGDGLDLCHEAGASGVRTGIDVSEDRLWVADRCNRRTLGFALPAESGDAAAIVLQQPDFFTRSHDGMPAEEHVTPVAVAADSEGRVYVGTEEHTVLVYDDPSESGQAPVATLLDVPEDIAAVRRLVLGEAAREVIAVVGAAELRFYPTGSVAPVSFWHLETHPCPSGQLADVAALNNVAGDDSLGDTLLVVCRDTANRCPAVDQGGNIPPSYNQPANACSSVYAARTSPASGPNEFRFPQLDAVYGSSIIPAYSLPDPILGIAFSEDLDALVIDDGGHRLLQFAAVRDHLDALFNQPPGTEHPYEARGEAHAAFAFGQANTEDRFPNRDPDGVGERAAADSLLHTGGVAIGSDGALWVADTGNHRVVGYANVAETSGSATLAIGQGSFRGRTADRLDASSTQRVSGLAFSPDGTLYVADDLSNRVLSMPDAASLPDGAAASAVIGQNRFDTGLPNDVGDGLQAGDLHAPSAVAVDPDTGDVFVADTGNGRILRYAPGETVPSTVIGAADFSTAGTSCLVFRSLAVRFGMLYVAAGSRADQPFCDDEPAAHRIFAYEVSGEPTADAIPERVFGQNQVSEPEPTPNAPNRGASDVFPDTLNDVGGLFVDADHRLWVADRGNHRVLWFDEADGPDEFEAAIADGVVGQTDLTGGEPFAGEGGPSEQSLSAPEDVVVDAEGGLWVSSKADHRVLYFATPRQAGAAPAANRVLGQPDFVSNEPDHGRTESALAGLEAPVNLALGAGGRTLAVADTGNRRVMLFHRNRPPEVGAALDHEVAAGDRLDISLALSDPDGDELEPPVVVRVTPPALSEAVTLDESLLRFAAPAGGAGTQAQVEIAVNDVAPVSRTTNARFTINVVSGDTGGGPDAGPAPDARRGGAADTSGSSCGGCAAAGGPSGMLPLLLVMALLGLRSRRTSSAGPHA